LMSALLDCAGLPFKPLATRPLPVLTPGLGWPAKRSFFPSHGRRLPFHDGPDAQAAIFLHLAGTNADLLSVFSCAHRASCKCDWSDCSFLRLIARIFAAGRTSPRRVVPGLSFSGPDLRSFGVSA